MPTPIAHSLMGYCLLPQADKLRLLREGAWKQAAIFIGLASLPDLDYIPGILIGDANRFHHGNFIVHSFGFGLIVWALIYAWMRLKRNPRAAYWLFWGYALYCSHLFLDFLSRDANPPIGQMLLWPLSREYFISPVPVFLHLKKSNWAEVFQLTNFFAGLLELAIFVPLAALLTWKAKRRAQPTGSLEAV